MTPIAICNLWLRFKPAIGVLRASHSCECVTCDHLTILHVVSTIRLPIAGPLCLYTTDTKLTFPRDQFVQIQSSAHVALLRRKCTLILPLQAVKDDWYYQMYYDDLPVWSFVGHVEKEFKAGSAAEFKYYLFTHVNFHIKYNEDRVIEINVETDPSLSVDISESVKTAITAKFTYSVKWIPTPTTFERRLQRYEKFPLDPVHLEVGS